MIDRTRGTAGIQDVKMQMQNKFMVFKHTWWEYTVIYIYLQSFVHVLLLFAPARMISVPN